MQVAIAYLCTRVQEPTVEVKDYVKLSRVIKYLHVTVHLPLVIRCDESGTLLWSIDTSFCVHNNMRIHTGAMLTLKKGAIFSLLNKQKVNSTNSTVVKIVGMDDVMNFVMWMKLFIEQHKDSTN